MIFSPPYPDPVALHLTGLAGQKMSLPPSDGKGFLLHLWATWCLPCREELPLLDGFLARSPSAPVVPVAVDSGAPEQVSAFLRRMNLAHVPAWTAPRDEVMTSVKDIKDFGLPTTLLIDGSGHIRAVSDGGLDWGDAHAASRLEKLLARVR